MRITEGTLPFRDLRLADADFENPRTHSGLGDAEIRETALSIIKHGLLVPLLVRPGGSPGDGLIIAGKRRYHALSLIQYWTNGGNVDLPEVTPTDWGGAGLLLTNIPVRFVSFDPGEEVSYQALALVDNLFRSDLSSFEIAAALADLSKDGKTGQAIARMIGKSPSYVSRKLSAWRKAGPELRAAWRDGMPEDAVEEFAALPLESQAKALAGPVPRGRRGPAHRPSVDAVRDFLHELELRGRSGNASDFAYTAGAIDALRWAAGVRTSPEFVKLAEPEA